MTLQLGPIIVCGELVNLSRNSVHGVLGIRDQDRPLHLQLTGNCQGELEGKHFRFEIQGGAAPAEGAEGAIDLADIAWDQVGPTGTMDLRPAAGPGGASRVSLYLEWHSQNGHIVVEILDPIVEIVDPSEEEDGMPEVGTSETVSWSPGERDVVPWEDEPPSLLAGLDESEDDDDDEREDPYGLFPEDLETQFEEAAQATDEAVLEPEDSEFARQMELYDEAVSEGGVPIREIFDPPMRIYRPDDLDDEKIAVEFQRLLARLALHGIALDMCQHATPRSAYKLLVEKILVEERTYPSLSPRGFVQHYMTHEYCPECDADLEEKYREFEPPRGANGDEGSSSGAEDDIPF